MFNEKTIEFVVGGRFISGRAISYDMVIVSVFLYVVGHVPLCEGYF